MRGLLGLCVVAGVVSTGSAQSPLAGRWGLEERVPPGLEAVVPAWEAIAVEGAEVIVTRGTAPQSVERYVVDDEERVVTRVAGQARACRAAWDSAALVVACRQTSRGPGGRAPTIATREVRAVDEAGRLVVELTWRSGDRDHRERRVYRRADEEAAR